MSKLSIPEYISLDREYMPGIGRTELRRLTLSAAPGLVAVIVAWFTVREPIQQLLCIGFGVGYIIICYGLFAKVDKQQSIYTYLAKIIRYWRNQKKYYYRQEQEVLRFADEE